MGTTPGPVGQWFGEHGTGIFGGVGDGCTGGTRNVTYDAQTQRIDAKGSICRHGAFIKGEQEKIGCRRVLSILCGYG